MLVSSIIVVANFFEYIIQGKLMSNSALWKTIEVGSVIIFPMIFFLIFDSSLDNDCCNESAIFSPEHGIGIYSLIVGYTIAYMI